MRKETLKMNIPVWQAMQRQGYYRGFGAAGEFSAESLLGDPLAAVERVLGVRPSGVKARFITPEPGGTSYIDSDVDSEFHTDHAVGTPAPVQFLFCIDPSETGGDSLLIDGWKLLDEAAQSDPTLYESLFTVPREMIIQPRSCVVPTFSLQDESLVLVHPPRSADPLGDLVQAWVDEQTPVRFRMEQGDYTVTHNHRMIHSRSPFTGYRKLVRILAWLDCPLTAPVEHLEFAGNRGQALHLTLRFPGSRVCLPWR